MAVIVTKEGSLTKTATCKRCKSELQYEPEDVKSTSYEDSPITYHIFCPFCEKKLGKNYSFVSVPDPAKETK